MFRYRRLVRFVLVMLIAAGSSAPASAQVGRPKLDLSIGAFHHSSTLHRYYSARFDDALVTGAGASLALHRMVTARVLLEHVSTSLSGGPVFQQDDGGPDNILAGEVQLAGAISITDRIRPYVGAGAGLRRYVVNSSILSDDIIHSPWAEPQIQPAFSAMAGVGVAITSRFGVAAEVRASLARFRAGHDTWGLPEDPVAWQRELRPTLRLEVSPW